MPFERPDVPRDVPHRNVRALVALAVIAASLVAGGAFLWRLAKANSSVGDSDLSAALSQGTTSAETGTGTAASTDAFTNVLVFTVDDVSADRPSLQRVQIMSLDVTARSGTLATLPSAMRVESGGTSSTLSDLFSSAGAAGCVSPVVDATGVTMAHVMVLDQSGWATLEGLSGEGASALVSKASDLLSAMRTDMTASDLLDLAEKAQSIGLSRLRQVTVDGTQETDGSGVAWTLVDPSSVGLAIGTLVSSS